MAINSPSFAGIPGVTDTAIDMSAPTQTGAANPFPSSTSAGGFRARGGLSSLASMGPSIFRNSGDDVTNAFVTHMREAVKTTDRAGWQTRVIPITRADQPDIAWSGIAIAVRAGEQPDVAVFVLIIGGSEAGPAPRSIPFQGQTWQIKYTPGDAWDASYVQAVSQHLQRTLSAAFGGVPLNDPILVGAMAVPQEVSTADVDRINQILSSAQYAAAHALVPTELEIEPGDRLTFAPRYRCPELTNVVGMPVLAPICVDTSTGSGRQSQDQTTINRQTGNRRLGGAGAYLQATYVGRIQQPGNYGFAPQVNNRVFAPEFVITAVESMGAATMPLLLLNACGFLSVSSNLAWMEGFRPDPNIPPGNVDHRDVGILGRVAGYEAASNGGRGQRAQLKGAGVQDQHIGEFLERIFHDRPMISVRVEEAGPMTWALAPLVEIACGGPAAAEANSMLIQQLNQFCRGKLMARLANAGDQNMPIMIENCPRVHLGYYVSSDGVRHDLANIGLIALANASGSDGSPTLVEADWVRTFDPQSAPEEVRLQQRLSLIELATHGVQVTGYARVPTFNGAFLKCFTEALVDAGLSMQVAGNQSRMRAQEMYAPGFYAAAAVGSVNFYTAADANGQHSGAGRAFFNTGFNTGIGQGHPTGFH